MTNIPDGSKFGIRLMSVNNVDGRWFILVKWKDVSGEYFMVFNENIRFRADAMFPDGEGSDLSERADEILEMHGKMGESEDPEKPNPFPI